MSNIFAISETECLALTIMSYLNSDTSCPFATSHCAGVHTDSQDVSLTDTGMNISMMSVYGGANNPYPHCYPITFDISVYV